MRGSLKRFAVLIGALSVWSCQFGGGARAEIRITRIELDGRVREISQGTKSLTVDSTAHTIRFHFSEADRDGRPTARLRYKLEGYDEAWRDLPVKMRAILYFRDRNAQVVGSSEFYLTGETPGWRGSVEASDFMQRREHAIAPERSASARVSILSHGGDAGVGIIGVDDIRLMVEHPPGASPKMFDLNVTKGSDLSQPLGSPANWIREGSRAELSQLLTRAAPAPHPMLVIADDNPFFFGNWATQTPIPIEPGDRVTFEWQTAHSIGGSGSGIAEYPRLKPGNYFFRVAAARSNGELTGSEISLPVSVVPPLYRRWEFWLVLAALTAAAAAWIGRVTVQRRMKHQLALEQERSRIARDLHDNIGAGLTEIAMQSDLVHSDLAQSPGANTQQRVARIRQSATELARSVDEIVWAINPANDDLKRFANYLTQYTSQFLDAAGLRVRFDIPQDLPATPLPGKNRHCLFLAIREALNNAVKHAQADVIRLEIRADSEGLRIVVEDNGRGFATDQFGTSGTHEGLVNMRRRMEEIGGIFQITSTPGAGTRIELRSKT